MTEIHGHCQPTKCREHEKDIKECTHCTRIGRPECTLIPQPDTCPRCGGKEGHCEHYRGF